MGLFDGILAPIAQIGGAILSPFLQQENNLKQEQAATRQMQFQQTMSDSAHQREVKDLQAAGLNPILSANAGASSPGGAQPTLTAPQIQMPDIMAYGLSLKQLEQGAQRLQLDQALGAASMAKTLDEREILKMEKILKQKGLIRANLEGTVADKASKMINTLTDQVRKPHFNNGKGVDLSIP